MTSRRSQTVVRMFYVKDPEKNHVYAHGMIQRLGEIASEFVVADDVGPSD